MKLEDELGDILWNILSFLHSLKEEYGYLDDIKGFIDKHNNCTPPPPLLRKNNTEGYNIINCRDYFYTIQQEIKKLETESTMENSEEILQKVGYITWNYFRLLETLKREKKIFKKSEVIRRCYRKYLERICLGWQEAKKFQENRIQREIQTNIIGK